MRSLAALVLLPLLAEAGLKTGYQRQQQCRNDGCFRAVGSRLYQEDRRNDCVNFVGSTTVTAEPSVLTAYATAVITGFVEIDATDTAIVPVTVVQTQQVTNILTSYVATVTSTVRAQETAYTVDLDKRQWNDWWRNAKMPGGYPLYAAACWDTSRYVSACNCGGVYLQTVTLPGDVSTTTLTVTMTGVFETRFKNIDENTVTNVVATDIATQTVDTVVQATQTVLVTVTVTDGANGQTTESPSSLVTIATPSVSSAFSSILSSSSDGPIVTVTATNDGSLTTTPTEFQNSTRGATLTSVITGESSKFPSFTVTLKDTASMSDLSTRVTQSLSSAVASDFPTSILTASTTLATSTATSTSTSTPTPNPTAIAKSFRLKVSAGPRASSYLSMQPWLDLGVQNGGQAYKITFAGGNSRSTGMPSLWVMGGGLDMPGTSNSSIYAVQPSARGKAIVATVGMNSRLAVAAPGAGAAFLASDLLQCAINADNLVTCREASVDGAPFNKLGDCGNDLSIFKDSNTCSGGNLFALTAEYV